MRLKLDENLGRACVQVLRDAGHDVETIVSEQLQGSPDPRVLDVCRSEKRILVTLDVELANPVIYPPSTHSGVVLLRIKGQVTLDLLLQAVRTLAGAMTSASPEGQIWIVQRDRVRIYVPE